MTDDNEITNTNTEPTKLDLLKEEASKLNITFHPNIKEEKLQLKLNDYYASQNNLDATLDKEPKEPEVVKPKLDLSLPENILTNHETQNQRRNRIRSEANRLVRVKIACMNPNKKDHQGEILTVCNSVSGTIKRYIPYNNDEGWHIPYMMFLHLKERKCQIFVKKRNDRGVLVAISKMIKEFSVELMAPLTDAEMKDLAQRQAAANGTAST